jgi:hypothetical protein
VEPLGTGDAIWQKPLMARYDQTTAEVVVFSFKEGLLSSVAHDLQLKVTSFVIDVESKVVKAEFDARSMQVVCAMKDGHENPGALPSFALAEIEKNLGGSVLLTSTFPAVRFETSLVSGTEVRGHLTLRGMTREVRGERRDEGSMAIATFRVDQRDFGIKPFAAMFGTLKVKPEVLVRVSLPLS